MEMIKLLAMSLTVKTQSCLGVSILFLEMLRRSELVKFRLIEKETMVYLIGQ